MLVKLCTKVNVSKNDEGNRHTPCTDNIASEKSTYDDDEDEVFSILSSSSLALLPSLQRSTAVFSITFFIVSAERCDFDDDMMFTAAPPWLTNLLFPSIPPPSTTKNFSRSVSSVSVAVRLSTVSPVSLALSAMSITTWARVLGTRGSQELELFKGWGSSAVIGLG